MAKLPKGVAKRIEDKQGHQIPWLVNIIYKQYKHPELLADYITEKPVAYYEGLLFGAYTMIEEMLMEYNCYRGFTEVVEEDMPSVNDVVEYRYYFV